MEGPNFQLVGVEEGVVVELRFEEVEGVEGVEEVEEGALELRDLLEEGEVVGGPLWEILWAIHLVEEGVVEGALLLTEENGGSVEILEVEVGPGDQVRNYWKSSLGVVLGASQNDHGDPHWLAGEQQQPSHHCQGVEEEGEEVVVEALQMNHVGEVSQLQN